MERLRFRITASDPFDVLERTLETDPSRQLDSMVGWPLRWRPLPGETLVGTIVRYRNVRTGYGVVCTVIVEKEDRERRSLWLSHTILISQFERAQPQVGDRIAVLFLGKPHGKDYFDYHVEVDRPLPALGLPPLGEEPDV